MLVRRSLLTVLFLYPALVAVVTALVLFPCRQAVASPTPPQIQGQLGKMTLPFIANQGQYPQNVAFSAATFSGAVFVTTKGELVYSLPQRNGKETSEGVVLRETVVGGAIKQVTGEGATPTKVQRFIGNDPSKWQRDLPTYERVQLGEVYKGINLHLKAYGQIVEKLFTVQPGAKPERIKMAIKGGKRLRINDKGELVVDTDYGPVSFSKPIAYQKRDGVEHLIEVAYHVKGNSYGFTVGDYEHTKPLVIDPVLMATFLGGTRERGESRVEAILISPTGDIYVAGMTTSPTLPGIKAQTVDSQFAGESEGFIARLNKGLSVIKAVTFLGGSGKEEVNSLAMAPLGKIYAAGVTTSSDFPGVTRNAADPQFNGDSEAFVTQLDDEQLIIEASTFLGGARGEALALAISSIGSIYVAGWTDVVSIFGFPGITPYAADSQSNPGDKEGFIAKLDSSLHTIESATYLGGSNVDKVNSLTITPVGTLYVAGQTNSADFPGITASSADNRFEAPGEEGFIARLDANLQLIEAATFLGGIDTDTVSALAVTPAGEVYVAGETASKNFPGITRQSIDDEIESKEGFVVWLDAALYVIEAATFLGGEGNDSVRTLAVDPRGAVYAAGWTTNGKHFPVIKQRAADKFVKAQEGFVVRLNRTLHAIEAATFLGGSQNDQALGVGLTEDNAIYIAGQTSSLDFPGIAEQSADIQLKGHVEGFIARLTADLQSIGPATFLGDLGGSPDSRIEAMTMTPMGTIYVAGWTGFPNPGLFPSSEVRGNRDVVVAQLDSELQNIERMTFLSGSNDEQATSIAVIAEGVVYVGGWTTSPDFPVVPKQAADDRFEGESEAFVVRLDPDLRILEGSTFLGGKEEDASSSIAVTLTGTVYVAGQTASADFPGMSNLAADPRFSFTEGFVLRLDPKLQKIEKASFVGGSAWDDVRALAVTYTGLVYVVGNTGSLDLPGMTNQAAYPQGHEGPEGFVMRLDADLQAVTAATYLGRGDNEAIALALAPMGAVYVAGWTEGGFQVTAQSADPRTVDDDEGFVVRFDADLQKLQAATYLGGEFGDRATSLAVDLQGRVYVTGITYSWDFPGVSTQSLDDLKDGDEGFLVRLDENLHQIEGATFLGGSRDEGMKALVVNLRDQVYVAGWTSSPNFPGVDSSAPVSSLTSSSDGFVARLELGTPPPYPKVTLLVKGNVELEVFPISTSLSSTLFALSDNINIAMSGCSTSMIPGFSVFSLADSSSSSLGCRILLDADLNKKDIQPFPEGTTLEFGVAGPLLDVQVTELLRGQIYRLAWRAAGDPDPAFDDLVVVLRVVDCFGCDNLDQDGDGLWDDWEEFGVDVNNDGAIDLDLPALGADPNQPDLFVEIDYMDCAVAGSKGESCTDGHSHRPKPAALVAAMDAFALGGQSRETVRLHLEVDQAIPHQEFMAFNTGGTDDFAALKERYFGKNNPKGLAYHYGIFAHRQKPGFFTSGRAEVLGNDFVVSLGGWNLEATTSDVDNDGLNDWHVGTLVQQAGTLLHELGHNLDLLHGGSDADNRKPNYPSVMNYAFQLSGVPGEEGTVLDPNRLRFSEGKYTRLNEKALNEGNGVSCSTCLPGEFAFRYLCPIPQCPVPQGTPINIRQGVSGQGTDWDCSGSINGTSLNDVNGDCKKTILRDADDWALMNFTFQSTADFATTENRSGSSDEADLVDLDVELTVARDSFVRSGAPQANEGGNVLLSVRAEHQTVLGFDFPPDLPHAEITQAILVLTEIPGEGAGKVDDEEIEVLSLPVAFTEGNGRGWQVRGASRGNGIGVTWKCVADANISDQRPECVTPWPSRKPQGVGELARVFQRKDEVWEWDVTMAVEAARAAGKSGADWLLQKQLRTVGSVEWYSREGARELVGDDSVAPRLIIRFN